MRQNLLQGKYGRHGHPATACNPAGMNQDEMHFSTTCHGLAQRYNNFVAVKDNHYIC